VEVDVTHVRANVGRPRDTDERVHVRPIHVDLPTVLVDDGADVRDRLLEHAMRGWIRHHQRREIRLVLLGLRVQVGDVDVAVRIRFHDDHLEPGHHGTRWVGAVCRPRNEADVAVPLPARLMVTTDDEQPGELAL
jgi:hypothetical protein